MDKIEYRVRPVTRYIVTRFHSLSSDKGDTGGVQTLGEYDNADVAHEVGYALCKAEHDRLGWPPGDERIKYPQRIEEGVEVKHMVDRFLMWSFPENISPDGGFSFKRTKPHPDSDIVYPMPVGTNLLDAQQAEAMVRHMIEGLPSGK